MKNTETYTFTRIDFYLLSHEKTTKTMHFVCRLIEKAFHSGHALYVYVDNQKTAERLDAQLWAFREDSFLPHATDIKNTMKTPIIISHQPPTNHGSVLINLTDHLIFSNQQFKRIFHVVPNTPKALQRARLAFKTYKQQGITPKTIHL